MNTEALVPIDLVGPNEPFVSSVNKQIVAPPQEQATPVLESQSKGLGALQSDAPPTEATNYSAGEGSVTELPKIGDVAVAIDAPPQSQIVVATQATNTATDPIALLKAVRGRLALPGLRGYVSSQKHGKTFAVVHSKGYPEAIALGSPELNARLRANARKKGASLKLRELEDLNDELRSEAEEYGVTLDIYPRVCPLETVGVEIDLCDGLGTTVRIEPSGVTVMPATSSTLFTRSPSAMAIPVPQVSGDYSLLEKYINLDPDFFRLYIAWLTFIIASPKIESTKYLFLVLKGSQGTGKTFASKTTKVIVDPNAVGAQTLPGSSRDLAIMLQTTHLLVIDNLRDLTTAISDILCIAATGGAVPMRKLYTDDEQKALYLHGAIVFNGIHPFIGQSDFADRCLVLDLIPIAPLERKSEAQMLADLELDRPSILGGLYNLTASVLQHLPNAKIVAPSRMLDFCRWLAGVEMAIGLPEGKLQYLYAECQRDAQLESLLDNPLAVTIIEFAEKLVSPEWIGTPTAFYDKLTSIAEFSAQRSRAWPSSAAVLSKRLHGLQAPMLAQGISIEWTRGKDRQIIVRKNRSMAPKPPVVTALEPIVIGPTGGGNADF